MPLTGVAAALPSQVEQARQLFLQTAEEILPERDQVVETFNELIEKWNEHWGWFHRNLWNRQGYQEEKEAIERIRTDLEETPFPEQTGGGSILDLADRVVNRHHPVVSLFLTSMRWVDDTMTPTSEVYQRIWTVADGRELGQWQGEARSAYDEIVTQQRDATEAVKDLAGFMSAWLAGIADDNVGYVTSLLESLAALATEIAATVAAIGTSGGLFSPLKLADFVGSIIGEAISELGEIAGRISAAVGRTIEAERTLNDHSRFPDGTWPVAVDRP